MRRAPATRRADGTLFARAEESSLDWEFMSNDFAEIRDAVARLCADFPGRYWRAKDRARAYPQEFVEALSAAGYLAVLIPEEYGGSGLGIQAAAAVLEEI